MQIRFVFVEGNIGAGKSTYLIRVLPRVQLPSGHVIIGVAEPLVAWTAIPDAGGGTKTHNLFAAFYADPTRYAALFQAHAMQTRLTAVARAIADCPVTTATDVLWVVCERSIYTDRNIFVGTLVANGTMSPLEHAVYEAWWQFWNGGRSPPYPLHCVDSAENPGELLSSSLSSSSSSIQGVWGAEPPSVVYLATPAPECQARMRRRDRAEETGVPLDYLAQLHRRHDEALAHGTRGWLGGPCLRVDVAEAGDFAANDECADACAMQLQTFLLKQV